jgi:hypothetical protein
MKKKTERGQRTETHDDFGEDEYAESRVGFLDDAWDGRDDKDDVAEKGNADSDNDGVVATKVRISDVRAK